MLFPDKKETPSDHRDSSDWREAMYASRFYFYFERDGSDYKTFLTKLTEELPSRIPELTALYGFELIQNKTAYHAWQALMIACRIGVPAPPWAGRLMDELHATKIRGEENVSFDRALGYTAGRGETPTMVQALDDEEDFEICTKIWVLHQLHHSTNEKRRYSIVALCEVIAAHFATRNIRGRGNSASRAHQIRMRCCDEKYASHLRKTYYAWKRAHEASWIPYAQQELRRRCKIENQKVRDTNVLLDRHGVPAMLQSRRPEISYADYLLKYTAPLRKDLGLT